MVSRDSLQNTLISKSNQSLSSIRFHYLAPFITFSVLDTARVLCIPYSDCIFFEFLSLSLTISQQSRENQKIGTKK